MPYLINCETYNCVKTSVMVGVALHKNGVFELLHNVSTLKNKSITRHYFKTNIDNISIFPITDIKYKYFNNYYIDYKNEIKINRKKYFNECNYDSVSELYQYFWHLPIKVHGITNNLLNEEFIDKYNNVIENQIPIL